MFEPTLDPMECRVLGCLVEKQLSTPEYYPLTLNALQNACNQSSNRDPVLRLEEEAIREALEGLRRRGLIFEVNVAGARVIKYEHRLEAVLDLSLQEAAILAELLLRGPQTPGELRNRCTRMYAFPDLKEVEAALELLAEADIAASLPRQPGTKEARFAHRLGDQPQAAAAAAPVPLRSAQLESEVAALREEFIQLRDAFEAFRKQFE